MPAELSKVLETRRYAAKAFISEPWHALFHTEAERWHSFDMAVAEYEALLTGYRRFGYKLVFLPQVSVEERRAFILKNLK